MRKVAGFLAAVGVVVLVTAAGTAGVARDATIKPGKGIGKVELGMTLAQVRRALGPPFVVIRRTSFGARGRYVEYMWEVGSMDIRTWTVGLRSTSRNGTLSVVRVSTTVQAQRTSEGLGVGSRPRDVFRRFPDAACRNRSEREKGWSGTWIVVEHRAGGMTAFRVESSRRSGEPFSPKVIEVLVQRSWLNDNGGEAHTCPPDIRD